MRALLIFALISWISSRIENSKKDRDRQFEVRPEDYSKMAPVSENETESLRQDKLDEIRDLLMGKEEVLVEEVSKPEPVITSEHSMEQKTEEFRPRRERMARIKFQEADSSSYREFDYNKKAKKKAGYSKDEMKKDIVKGFIFSEVIAEPKSRRNKNESI